MATTSATPPACPLDTFRPVNQAARNRRTGSTWPPRLRLVFKIITEQQYVPLTPTGSLAALQIIGPIWG